MLSQYKAIDWEVPGAYPLAVILHLGTTIVRFDGVSMQIQYHILSRFNDPLYTLPQHTLMCKLAAQLTVLKLPIRRP